MPLPTERYERLIAQNDSQLSVTLQALSLTRSTLALPPRKRCVRSSKLFPPLSSQSDIMEPGKAVPEPVLSDRVVKAIVVAAMRERRQKGRFGIARQGGAIARRRGTESTRDTRVGAPPKAVPSFPRSTSENEEDRVKESKTDFRTARSRLPLKRRAGMQARPRGKMQKPLHKRLHTQSTANTPANTTDEKEIPEVPNVEPRLVECIMQEMLEDAPNVDWGDIAGLKFAKNCVMEAVVWPMLRPDIFTGLRGPPKGLLLFGPPGTGKTMIGRAIASKSGAKFFNISASSLVSKWAGEGEKTVRALFAVARVFQPAVVFIDEIDSLLTSRTEGEQEFSRRIKTEFLVQMDGAGTRREDRVLVVGATNRPQELDEAARRRLVKRLYIPLPDHDARVSLVGKLLEKQMHQLGERDVAEVAMATKGYSGSDMYALCAEAAMIPVRELGECIVDVDVGKVRPVRKEDLLKAVGMVRASVGERDLEGYKEWNDRFGSFPSGDSDGGGVG